MRSSSTLICPQTLVFAGVIRRIAVPGVVAELARPGDGVEDPQALAGAHVEAAHKAFHIGSRARHAAGAMGRADNDYVLRDNRSRVQPNFAGDEIHFLIVVGLQIDDAVGAEARDGRTSFGVEGDHEIARRDIDDALVGTAFSPIGEAASRQLPGSGFPPRAFVLTMNPQLLAGRRVHGDDFAIGSGGRVHDALDDQRRGFEVVFGTRAERVGMESPGDLEFIEIRCVDRD